MEYEVQAKFSINEINRLKSALNTELAALKNVLAHAPNSERSKISKEIAETERLISDLA